MIVDPDFPDHWKTRTLVGLLGDDEAAPVYVIRLWAHCQNRRQWRFTNLSPEALKALCRFPGHANKLEASLATSGFVRREADVLTVCGWEEYNASLVAAWNNGAKGGRPKKPVGSQQAGDQKPAGSGPTGAEKPVGSQPQTGAEKPAGSRKEERREDIAPPPTPPAGGGAAAEEFVATWNAAAQAAGWIHCREMNPKRLQALRVRLRSPPWAAAWKQAIERARGIPGLSGNNQRNWQADVDWFLRPDTVIRILEGKYDSWGRDAPGRNGKPDPVAEIMRQAHAAMKTKETQCPPT